ncbi:MAG: sulfotransferase domain-containing protein [Bacteroidota bacterium]
MQTGSVEGPLIHIGYHKTGTTWLQQFLFHPELGFTPLVPPHKRPAFGASFIYPSELQFDTEAARATYASRIRAIRQMGLVPVLSAERLSGAFQAGGYDSATIARRLRETFPTGKILIVIREQSSMILSSYVQYVRAGGARNLTAYFKKAQRAPGFVPGFSLGHFHYDRLIAYYQLLFGKDRVLVMTYETFRQRPADFVGAIRQFSGLPPVDQVLPMDKKVNTSYGPFTLFWKRQYNRFFLDSSLNPGVWWPLPNGVERRVVLFLQAIEKVLPEGWKNRRMNRMKCSIQQVIGNEFVDSNIRTI